MKKLIYLLVVLVITVAATADNFTNKYPRQKLNFNKTTDATVTVDLDFDEPVTSFSISGTCKLDDANRALFRAILVDNNGNEYLVSEYIGYLEEKKNISFKNNCIETILLDNVIPSKLKLIISQSRVHITGIEYSTDMSLSEKELAKMARKSQHKDFADKYQRHNDAKGFLWMADTIDTASLTYAEKRTMFGDGSDYFFSDGMEYYAGGFFVVSENMDPLQQQAPVNSKYVSEFDWTHRHGRNWITSVKNQKSPNKPGVHNNGCWAFSIAALAESYVNLYYNQKINLDLSEQQIVSCSGIAKPNGKGFTNDAGKYVAQNGIVNESCFPYSNTLETCGNQCTSPTQVVHPEYFEDLCEMYEYSNSKLYKTYTEETLKEWLINKGPLSANIPGHSMLLVGYGVIRAGDVVYLRGDQDQSDENYTISSDSPYVGRTYWKFKNSNGTSWGKNGYCNVIYQYFDKDCSINGYFDGGFQSIIGYTESDRKCEDLDGDGYYNWGIGPKPAHCPECPDLPDGNDYNPNVGGMNEYGVSMDLTNPLAEPYISGPDAIGCSGTYTIMNVNDKVKVKWNKYITTTGSPLGFPGSTQDAMINVTQGFNGNPLLGNTEPYVGPASLNAELESDGVTKKLTKKLYVYGDHKPAISSSIRFNLADINKPVTFTETGCDDIPAEFLEWTVSYPSGRPGDVPRIIKYIGRRSIVVTPTVYGTWTVQVKNTLPCAHTAEHVTTYTFQVVQVSSQLTHNNPVSDVLNISIEEPENTGESGRNMIMPMSATADVYTVEIWHEIYGKVKRVETESVTLDIGVGDLPEGNYIIRLLKNGELQDTSALLIKR